MAREIDVDAFASARAEGAYVLDVREPDEYAAGHVPGARNVPVGKVGEQAATLPESRPVYMICQSGRRSMQAADELLGRGVEAVSVAGGTNAWVASGRQVATGPETA
ncbi:MAG: rhodanese-like domain-containing protein [Candidatus Dormiibacterota bacterium]